jgi:CHAT domain/SIR2-like domain
MPGDADVEFGLAWRTDGAARVAGVPNAAVLDADPVDTAELEVNVRFEHPAENVDRVLPRVPPVSIDLRQLRSLTADEEAYGNALTQMVLRSGDVLPFVQEILAVADSEELTLHLRLHINAPPQFHAVRWECLRDPRSGDPLATRSHVFVSRYLTSPDWRPIPAVPKHDMHAVIVVAAPRDIDTFAPNGRSLARVDVDDELARARTALADFRRVTELAKGDATLAGLLVALETGVDVLYLVCHGALIEDVPLLYLEKPDATTDRVDGRRLVERVSALPTRPTVVMLCSCQSATGTDEQWSADEGDLSGLGPRLAASGVSAVVAMQGNVSVTTASTFAPVFFEALREHGVVDRAMATARRAVRDRPDWWVPVLFSRLRSGRTYYRPEFTSRADSTWETLRLQVQYGHFTPVLGPGLADPILGSRQDIAHRWVERWQMPLAAHRHGDLAQAAQYLRVRSAPGTVPVQLIAYLCEEIARRSEKAERGDPFSDLPLDPQRPLDTITEVGRRIRCNDPGDPYRVMAALPVSIYVTTAWTNLLQDALREADPPREAVTMVFPWGDQRADIEALETLEEPTRERPLVYHVFGRLDREDSLVLTEDDYFQWMASWVARRKDIPTDVLRALAERSLMFVGFRLDDWDFRVLFNAIKHSVAARMFGKHLHVGVQLSPEHELIQPEAAQEYLESYFASDRVNVFWGDTRHFLDEFRHRVGLQT